MTFGRFSDTAARILVVLLFVPVFFQLDGRLYTDPLTLEAPRRFITNLPLPVSVLASAVALSLWMRTWSRDRLFLILAAAVPLMILTSLLAAPSLTWPKAKLLLFQFALPIAGFAIGRELVRRDQRQQWLGRWLLVVGAVSIGAHLGSTWIWHGKAALAEDVFGLGIYGHLQYVPSILVTVYVAGLYTAWEDRRQSPTFWHAATVMLPVVSLYAAASMSMTAMLSLWVGLTVFAALRMPPSQRRWAAVRLVLAVVICVTYVGLATSRVTVFKSKYLGVTDVDRSASGKSRPRAPGTSSYLSPEAEAARRNAVVLPNMSERLVYWRYFAGASTTDARIFLTGHAEQPDIRDYPSAHNYYLDYLYNFGFLALVPLLAVLVMTVRDLWRVRHILPVSPALVGLGTAAFYLLLVDNGLRVGMRQPYPGLATFALWGMLTARLAAVRSRHDAVTPANRTAA